MSGTYRKGSDGMKDVPLVAADIGQESADDVFPARLKAMRNKQQIDQKTLAELCGLSKDMIGQYERGEKMPSLKTAITMADYFDVSLDYLLGR